VLQTKNSFSQKESSSANIGNANLKVELTFRNKKKELLKNAEIADVSLSCTKIPRTGGEGTDIVSYDEPTSPKSWCYQQALNVPAKTDEDGKLNAFFFLDPPPTSENVDLDPGPLYTRPMIYTKVNMETQAGGSEALQPDVWEKEVDLVTQ
jgi:hypothetical protein